MTYADRLVPGEKPDSYYEPILNLAAAEYLLDLIEFFDPDAPFPWTDDFFYTLAHRMFLNLEAWKCMYPGDAAWSDQIAERTRLALRVLESVGKGKGA